MCIDPLGSTRKLGADLDFYSAVFLNGSHMLTMLVMVFIEYGVDWLLWQNTSDASASAPSRKEDESM